jgi:hypothetical protein
MPKTQNTATATHHHHHHERLAPLDSSRCGARSIWGVPLTAGKVTHCGTSGDSRRCSPKTGTERSRSPGGSTCA